MIMGAAEARGRTAGHKAGNAMRGAEGRGVGWDQVGLTLLEAHRDEGADQVGGTPEIA
jgi:hypothetical protein